MRAFGNPIHSAASLEKCPDASELIHVADSGIIAVRLDDDGQGSHAIGFRDGKMHVPDPILVSQLYASAVGTDVWFSKSNAEVATARAIKRQASQTPVSIREDTPMTEAELEGLKTRLVNEIMGSLSA